MKPVLFYGHREGAYAAFSNWYPASFTLKGMQWANSEQALMYFKSDDPDYRQVVRATTDPGRVKKLGRMVKLRPDWDVIKYGLMVRILYAKFSQNPLLRDLLLSTGDRPIHENCSDEWWGGGPNYPNGRDLLGKALMEVRRQLLLAGVTAYVELCKCGIAEGENPDCPVHPTTSQQRAAVERMWAMTPEELGKAAVEAARKR